MSVDVRETVDVLDSDADLAAENVFVSLSESEPEGDVERELETLCCDRVFVSE